MQNFFTSHTVTAWESTKHMVLTRLNLCSKLHIVLFGQFLTGGKQMMQRKSNSASQTVQTNKAPIMMTVG